MTSFARSPRFCLIAVLIGISLPTIAQGGPQIYWNSDPVSPGDSVLVTGDGLKDVVSVEITRLTDNKDDAATDGNASAKPIQENDQSIRFIIPENLRSGVYSYRLTSRDGAAEGCLNCPVIYWTQGDLGTRSTPGGWTRVLGRNIARS